MLNVLVKETQDCDDGAAAQCSVACLLVGQQTDA